MSELLDSEQTLERLPSSEEFALAILDESPDAEKVIAENQTADEL